MLEVFGWLLIGRVMRRRDEQGFEEFVICHEDSSEQFAESWSMVWAVEEYCRTMPQISRAKGTDGPGTLGYSCCIPCSSSVGCLSGSCKDGEL
jgi:hypothetical protein